MNAREYYDSLSLDQQAELDSLPEGLRRTFDELINMGGIFAVFDYDDFEPEMYVPNSPILVRPKEDDSEGYPEVIVIFQVNPQITIPLCPEAAADVIERYFNQ